MRTSDNYRNRLVEIEHGINRLIRRDNYFSVARFASFLLFLLSVVFIVDSAGKILPVLLSIASLIVFVRLVIMHLDLQELIKREKARKEMIENEINCLDLKPASYYNGSYFTDPEHDYSVDMDLFGSRSLFHYINRCATGVGNQALARWLSTESLAKEIVIRQKAVQELAQIEQWCEDMRVSVFERRIKDFAKEHLPEIKKTIETPKHLKIWIILSYSLLALSLGTILLTGGNGAIITLPIIFNVFLNSRLSKFTKTIRAQLEGREKTLHDYYLLLTSFEKQKFGSESLKQMQEDLKTDGISATKAITRLQELSKKLDYSLNMIAGAFLNIFFIWDILVSKNISRWFGQYSPKTSQWFDVVGRLEALISLSCLQNNHPTWSYPAIGEGSFHFSGKNLGHPLIPESERVCNDYTLSGTTLLNIITGSNMAGKSTFLRTIGVNIILAKAGTVACAQKLEISHFRIMTYLTITDSLAENTSTFYREIKRLKKILDCARVDSNILLLLDELLRGTNSADKAKGSLAIARELVSLRVPSLIATHNLELAEIKKIHPELTDNYYFDIIIDAQGKMRFDYKLKPGICDTFNASLLLKEIGIDIGNHGE
jgi:DNA mismatch repair ATPase MutS